MITMKRTLNAVLTLSALNLGAADARAESPDAAKARAEIQKTFGFVPTFLQQTPDSALPGAWRELASVEMSQTTALSCKVKELIGLAVAAQVPCQYCTYAHTEFAKLSGGTSDEIGEAVAMAALTRHWSTFMNGIQLDETKFRAEVGQVVANLKKGPGTSPLRVIAIVDAKSALDDVRQTFGFAPDFIARFPSEGLPGAWTEMKGVEMNPGTKLPGKIKSLIGLAVGSQIPCRYCVYADTEFAKLEGVTDREIAEAVVMASVTRHWSTILNGIQIDEAQHRRDVDRVVAGAKQAMVSSHDSKGAR